MVFSHLIKTSMMQIPVADTKHSPSLSISCHKFSSGRIPTGCDFRKLGCPHAEVDVECSAIIRQVNISVCISARRRTRCHKSPNGCFQSNIIDTSTVSICTAIQSHRLPEHRVLWCVYSNDTLRQTQQSRYYSLSSQKSSNRDNLQSSMTLGPDISLPWDEVTNARRTLYRVPTNSLLIWVLGNWRVS
jgi:hypothetical protein